ncbi:MAG: DUF885 domain-containing protein [Acidobacteriota bacterium]
MIARRSRRSLALCALVAALVSCQPAPDAVSTADLELDVLFEEVWADALDRSPYFRLREGLPIESLGDPSFAEYQDFAEKARGWRARLDALDAEALSHEDFVGARALAWDLDIAIEGERWFHHASVLTPYSSPLSGLTQILALVPLQSEDDAERYLALLGQVPGFIGALESHVRDQAARGIFVWRDNFEASAGLLQTFAATDGRSLFAPSAPRLEGLAESIRSKVADEATALALGDIDAAVRSLLDFLRSDDYYPQTPTEVGASALPDGAEYYRYAVRRSTTMEVAPEAIHERGLALVEEMEREMTRLRGEIGFDGSREEFRASLRTDVRYFPKSPDEVGARLMDAAVDMEKVVDDYFIGRPQAEYGVRRLEANREASLTYGIYEPPTPADPVGRYRYNGSKLDQRAWINLRGISLHELIPGHHFHIARQAESEDLPDYRRNMWHGAYTEGWGSYASYLGLEAGIYAGDPLSEYGMYTLEVFLATRLVVDTGMNLLGWSLEEARDFMREHTLESETQIGTESLRYSADMPAQALAYQMGKLEILELRRRASEALGERFDLRLFHETLLENGSLPMAVLAEHVDWWIEQQDS